MLVDGVEDHAGVVGPGTIRYRAPRHRARISNMRLRQRHKIIKAGTGPIIASPDLYGPLLVETMFQLREASQRSEEHTSELQSLMRISYAVFCLKKNTVLQYN